MKQDGLVSVVMCFLDGEAWIGEAICSVLLQDYPNWELILVDDGSTDSATNIALDFAAKHPARIHYSAHPGHVNRGLTISRNAGVALASGQWIAFLDADDVWLPGKLSADLRLFSLYPAAAMICQASRFWYSWEDANRPDVYTPVGAEPDRLYAPPALGELLYPLGSGAPPCPSGIIVTAEAFHRVGGFEESFHGIFGLYEDQAFLAKIYLREQVYVAGMANNLYRKHSGSMTDMLRDEALYNKVRMFFLTWLEQYLAANGPVPAAISKRLKTAQQQLEGMEVG